MADNSSASLNVHECSWADLTATLNIPGGATVTITDFEAFKWGRKNERGESRGTSGRVKKRTRGQPSCEGSATATRGGWMGLIEALEAVSISLGRARGDVIPIGSIDFDLMLQHTPLGESRVYFVKMVGCSLDGDSSDMKQGSDADMIELVTNPIEIRTKSGATGNWLVLA